MSNTFKADGTLLALDGSALTGVSGGGGGGLTQSYLGTTSVGATQVLFPTNTRILKQFTLAAPALVVSLDMYLDGNATNTAFAAGLMTDTGGNPDLPLAVAGTAYSSSGDLVNGGVVDSTYGPRWVAIALGIWLPAGTYWANVGNRGSAFAYKDTGGTDQTSGSVQTIDAAYAACTPTTDNYSMRISVLSGGGGGSAPGRILQTVQAVQTADYSPPTVTGWTTYDPTVLVGNITIAAGSDLLITLNASMSIGTTDYAALRFTVNGTPYRPMGGPNASGPYATSGVSGTLLLTNPGAGPYAVGLEWIDGQSALGNLLCRAATIPYEAATITMQEISG